MKVLLLDGKLLNPIYNVPSSVGPASLEMRKFVANEIPELRSSIKESVAGLRMLSGGGQARS